MSRAARMGGARVVVDALPTLLGLDEVPLS